MRSSPLFPSIFSKGSNSKKIGTLASIVMGLAATFGDIENVYAEGPAQVIEPRPPLIGHFGHSPLQDHPPIPECREGDPKFPPSQYRQQCIDALARRSKVGAGLPEAGVTTTAPSTPKPKAAKKVATPSFQKPLTPVSPEVLERVRIVQEANGVIGEACGLFKNHPNSELGQAIDELGGLRDILKRANRLSAQAKTPEEKQVIDQEARAVAKELLSKMDTVRRVMRNITKQETPGIPMS